MPLALITSSHVAASRVGGTLAALTLALCPAEVDPIHIPTTLLGRHPGWGKPGGGAVDAAMMRAMLQGVAANGLYRLCDAVLTGYFIDRAQAEAAAEAIDAVRAVNPAAIILVDPVIGDDPSGPYVTPAVADAIAELLAPRADVITPNRFELAHLARRRVETEAEAIDAARSLGVDTVIVTSAPAGLDSAIATLLVTPRATWRCTHPSVETKVKGTGDLLAAAFIARRLEGLDAPAAFASAMGVTLHVIEAAARWEAPELPIVGDREAWEAPPLVLEQVDGAG
jgi:pyridoxine kinase